MPEGGIKEKFPTVNLPAFSSQDEIEDISSTDDYWELYTAPQDFESVKKALDDAEIEVETAEITRIASNQVTLDAAGARKILKLISDLEDHDDVNAIYNNLALTDEVIAELQKDD